MIKILIPGYTLSKAVGSDRAKCPGACSLVRCFFFFCPKQNTLKKETLRCGKDWGKKKKKERIVSN